MTDGLVEGASDTLTLVRCRGGGSSRADRWQSEHWATAQAPRVSPLWLLPDHILADSVERLLGRAIRDDVAGRSYLLRGATVGSSDGLW